ncbi:hypothetical protein VNO78_18690 [Psophocarpus tetragonolobus]|uniref:Protein APEM9 n=1 Tax=Psophocarpus tetragonolobus TaxID=3891 RepID=A0AAN9XM91_PSOTE
MGWPNLISAEDLPPSSLVPSQFLLPHSSALYSSSFCASKVAAAAFPKSLAGKRVIQTRTTKQGSHSHPPSLDTPTLTLTVSRLTLRQVLFVSHSPFLATFRRTLAPETMDSESAIWKEIEVSESYLVCCMYEEAASSACSIMEQLRNDTALAAVDMLESSAMVLLQAFNQLGRTAEILNQLRPYFIPLQAIPPRLLLTGACFQIAQGSLLGVPEFLDEFLSGWSLEDVQYCAVIKETNVEGRSIHQRCFVLEIDEYLQVVEVYVVTLLATVLKDLDLAISWVENASLPEENQQGLLRRLHSMHSPKSTILSQNSFPQSPTNSNEGYSLKEQNASEGLPKALKNKHIGNKKYRSKEAVSKLSEKIEACFWCFRGINLKIGTTKFVITSGKIMLGCLIVFIYYVFRKKQTTLKRIVRRQVIAVKRALVDLWHLAFSYQVNPLAAVQPLSAATHPGQLPMP